MTPGQYILVVDDDDDFREALSEVLTDAGYPVQMAENGEVALTKVAEEAPGIVLLDLKMPVLERHRAAVDVVRRSARVDGPVVTVDLVGSGIESSNKFIAYDLFPQAAYAVVVSQDPKRTKVSVGSNPWSRPARPHDISRLCERYGGGGHAVVGAVSLPPGRAADARRIAGEIAHALQAEPPSP